MSGFIAMSRTALDHPLLKDGAHFRAWFWLVSTAAWKPTRFNIAGKLVTLERGQVCASIRQLADAWGMSKSAVDRFLSRLETETMIVRDAGHGRCVITICNYEKYQSAAEVERDSSGTAAGQQRDTKEQGNKETREPNGSHKPPISPFPRPDWADPQVWSDWMDVRKSKKARNTATAHAGFLTDIAKLTNDEWPPGRLLEHAVAQSWAGIYEPKEDYPTSGRPKHRNTPQSAPRNRDGVAAALDRRLGFNDAAGSVDRRTISDGRSDGGGTVAYLAAVR